MTTPRVRLRIAALLLLAAIASSCGLFGDDDASASPADDPDVAVGSVRVESGDRWFDIDPGSVTVDASGQPTAATLTSLERQVANLSLTPVPPTDAGIRGEGSTFVVIPSIVGQDPDVAALARDIVSAAAGGNSTVALPFAPVSATLTDDEAQAYADELNERVSGGVAVSIGGDKGTLPASSLVPATSVTRRGGEWRVSVDFTRIDAELSRMFPEIGQQGGEASFNVIPGVDGEEGTVVLVPGAPRTVCCDAASARRIEQAMTTDLAVATLLYENVEGVRGTEWATELGINELVGSFTTSYTAGQSRVTNIRRIAELTQGAIIEPGETFSLNEFVGQRTTAKGFVPAGTIVNGHLVDSVGGGISQFATTIFNASFFAGLEFDEYQSHSIYFSRYPYGREATISWPAPALKIHNPTPYGILIWPTSTETSVTVDLYSTKWADVEQTGQRESTIGVACTRVTTERTRTFVDGTTDVDTVFATYRAEGIGCDGNPTRNPNDPVEDPDAEDPDGENPGSTTTTTVAPTTTTTVAPTTTNPNATTTTTTTTTTVTSTTTTTTTTAASPTTGSTTTTVG